jgi:hypothetical protein
MLGAEHLVVWDQAAAARPSSRAAVLAYGFGGAASLQESAAGPIGARDAYLLAVHRAAFTLTCRRPSAVDVATAWSAAVSPDDARRRLCRACLDAHATDGDLLEDLDENVIAVVSAALATEDPLADIRFALACPACAQAWEALFDPPRVLWRAFDAWARTAMADVSRLAREYGWSEQDILAMHPSRRRFYLDAAL